MFKFLENYVRRIADEIKDDVLEDMQGRLNETEDSLRDEIRDAVIGVNDECTYKIDQTEHDIKDELRSLSDEIKCELEGSSVDDILIYHNTRNLERLVKKLEEVKENLNDE